MSLNIKNETVHELARKAAAKTGMSQTSVVEEALRSYLETVERAARYDEADRVLKDMQQRLANADAPRRYIEDLYDPETGLPA